MIFGRAARGVRTSCFNLLLRRPRREVENLVGSRAGMCRERVRACAGGSVAGMGEAVRERRVELVHNSRSLHSMHFAVNVEDEDQARAVLSESSKSSAESEFGLSRRRPTSDQPLDLSDCGYVILVVLCIIPLYQIKSPSVMAFSYTHISTHRTSGGVKHCHKPQSKLSSKRHDSGTFQPIHKVTARGLRPG